MVLLVTRRDADIVSLYIVKTEAVHILDGLCFID